MNMLEELFDSPALLATAIGGFAIANYIVALWVLREYARQPFVSDADVSLPGVPGGVRTQAARFALPLAGAAATVLLTFVLDRTSREILVGGVLVMEMASLGSHVADLLSIRALQRSDAADGRLRYSAGYRYRAGAARLVGMGIVTGLTGALFYSWPFLMGTMFLFATAVGWHRRARQASSASGRR